MVISREGLSTLLAFEVLFDLQKETGLNAKGGFSVVDLPDLCLNNFECNANNTLHKEQ